MDNIYAGNMFTNLKKQVEKSMKSHCFVTINEWKLWLIRRLFINVDKSTPKSYSKVRHLTERLKLSDLMAIVKSR